MSGALFDPHATSGANAAGILANHTEHRGANYGLKQTRNYDGVRVRFVRCWAVKWTQERTTAAGDMRAIKANKSAWKTDGFLGRFLCPKRNSTYTDAGIGEILKTANATAYASANNR